MDKREMLKAIPFAVLSGVAWLTGCGGSPSPVSEQPSPHPPPRPPAPNPSPEPPEEPLVPPESNDESAPTPPAPDEPEPQPEPNEPTEEPNRITVAVKFVPLSETRGAQLEPGSTVIGAIRATFGCNEQANPTIIAGIADNYRYTVNGIGPTDPVTGYQLYAGDLILERACQIKVWPIT